MKSYKYIVKNLDCAACSKKIEDKIASYDEYKNVSLNFATLKLSFETDKDKNVKQEVQKIITSVEPEVEIIEENEQNKSEESIKGDLVRLAIRNSAIRFSNAN
mgnify:FL=1